MRLLVLCLVMLVSCAPEVNHHGVVKEAKGGLSPQFARGFQVHFHDSSSTIVLFDLEHPGDTLQVVEWGEGPPESVVCLSTTHIALLDKLDVLHTVKAVGFADLVRNANARLLIDKGHMMNLTRAGKVDDEVLMSISPQIFFTYPYDHVQYRGCHEGGVRCIPVSEYLETSPLGRFEWIKLFGVLYQRQAEADSIFNSTMQRYTALREKVSRLVKPEDRPSVFTGSASGGLWFAPPGNSFTAQLLNDAGAHYIYGEVRQQTNLNLQMEKLLSDAAGCDYWGTLVSAAGPVHKTDLLQGHEALGRLEACQSGHIFYCNTYESDYFGDALADPYTLLNDLVAIFHPQLAEPGAGVYFKLLKD